MKQHELDNKAYYINRELSMLAFNRRVFSQALDESVPILERLRFLFIVCNNLDEFFEIRVAGLKQHVAMGSFHAGSDGLSPQQVLQQISDVTHQFVQQIYQTFDELIHELAQNDVLLLSQAKWNKDQKKWVKKYFHNEILPLISPISLDSAHPFPQITNKNLSFIVTLKGQDAFDRHSGLAVVNVPRSIPRVIPDPFEQNQLFFLTSILKAHVSELFPGMTVTGCYQFRVTRNSDLLFDEEAIEDLALALKTSLLERRYGSAVRLEIDINCPDDLVEYLLQKHNLTQEETYRVDGPVNLSRFMMILKLIDRPDLCYTPINPYIPHTLQRKKDIFETIRAQDILLQHPFDSFEPVLDLIHQATIDPNVLAIKQTLYRTGAKSQMVTALVDAARAGKQVTVVVELRARFDEASNIELATLLQKAGALVIYGIVGYKTHSKMTLIVRREQKKLRYYAHLGTGNYHAATTRLYTDFGLMTYDQVIGDDVQQIFQLLTGMGKAAKPKKLLYSPFTLSSTILNLIEHEVKLAKQGKPARIIAKMNAITDSHIIQTLYRASQAGVKIDLIVRGICCLRPGIKGVSDNIRVHSIVGRFLEHSRIFYFNHGGQEKVLLGSADWMERNLYYRVEVVFPIEDPKLAQSIIKNVLHKYLRDNCQRWTLQANGEYKRMKPGKQAKRYAQMQLLEQRSED